VSSSSKKFGFEGVNDVASHVFFAMRDVDWNTADSIRKSLVPAHDMCHSSRLIQHPSIPSAANATGMLLDDRNNH
jgi:hypothetical protein